MKYRLKQSTDQEKTQKAFELLLDLIQDHQKDIEPALWTGAMMASLAENFEKSGIPFEWFKSEMIKCIEYYRY